MRPTPRRANGAKSCLTGCAVQFIGFFFSIIPLIVVLVLPRRTRV